MNYGKALRNILLQKNMKQKDLVSKTRLSQTHISTIMNNKAAPSQHAVSKIAKAVGVPAEIINIMAISVEEVPKAYQPLLDGLVTAIDNLNKHIASMKLK